LSSPLSGLLFLSFPFRYFSCQRQAESRPKEGDGSASAPLPQRGRGADCFAAERKLLWSKGEAEEINLLSLPSPQRGVRGSPLPQRGSKGLCLLPKEETAENPYPKGTVKQHASLSSVSPSPFGARGVSSAPSPCPKGVCFAAGRGLRSSMLCSEGDPCPLSVPNGVESKGSALLAPMGLGEEEAAPLPLPLPSSPLGRGE
jgi:hypothetical protein